MDGQMNDFAIWNVKLPATGTNSVATLYGDGEGTVKRATSVSEENIVAYWDGSDATIPVPNQAVTTYSYPNIPNGAIFEESDTGKHYMFDGSQTWNEM